MHEDRLPIPFAGDTTREAREAQYAALRRMTPEQRLAMMDDLTTMVRSIAREGIRRRHPDASEEELDLLLCELSYGREIADQVRERRRLGRARAEP